MQSAAWVQKSAARLSGQCSKKRAHLDSSEIRTAPPLFQDGRGAHSSASPNSEIHKLPLINHLQCCGLAQPHRKVSFRVTRASTGYIVTCQATSKNGEPCRAQALQNSQYCFFHDPASKGERTAAQGKGGRNRSNLRQVMGDPDLLLYNLDLKDANKSAELTNLTAYKLFNGEIDVKTAHTIACLVTVAQRINVIRERQNARRLELGVPRVSQPDIHELLQHPECEVRQHLAQLTDEQLQDMLERGFGLGACPSILQLRGSKGNRSGT